MIFFACYKFKWNTYYKGTILMMNKIKKTLGLDKDHDKHHDTKTHEHKHGVDKLHEVSHNVANRVNNLFAPKKQPAATTQEVKAEAPTSTPTVKM